MPPVKHNRPRDDNGHLTPTLPVPLYEHVMRLVSEGILMGTWPPGTVLPGEVALAADYGVAVGTVRRALAVLVAEGLLVRQRKIGTVVTGRQPHHSLRDFFQYFRLHRADGSLLLSETRVLSLTRAAPTADEAEALSTSADELVIRLHRLREVASVPAMHERLTLPARRLPDFPCSSADVPHLLYRHLVERYGIRISAVREKLTAELASPLDGQLLAVTRPAALLVIDETAYDQAGRPMVLGHRRALTRDTVYLNEVS